MAASYEKMVGGERLNLIKKTIHRNVSCCRYALEHNQQVSILAKGLNTRGNITKISWDDLEDLVHVTTIEGKLERFSGSELTTVRLL